MRFTQIRFTALTMLFLIALFGLTFAQTRAGIAPQQTTDEEIKYDDGTPEGTPIGSQPNLMVVNRLTPSRYPATLKTIRIFFRSTTPLSPVGRQIRLLAFTQPTSNSGVISNPNFVVNQPVTIPSVTTAGQFVDFPITNGPTITSGDFFVGFQQPNSNDVAFFWYDLSQPQNNRGLASLDNGATFLTGVTTQNQEPVNFMIRAVVSTSTASTHATVSAASFAPGGDLAPAAIAAAFGTNLAPALMAATTAPLPTTLNGTSVRIRDSAGMERLAPLFFVAPGQVNFQVPPETALGTATITITNNSDGTSVGTSNIATIAPGLFTFNANGTGVPAANVLRIKSGVQMYEPLAKQEGGQWVPLPIPINQFDEQVFIILFGTGLRGRTALANTSVTIGGLPAQITYAGAQGLLTGLDQLNVFVPAELNVRGEADLVVTVDGRKTNSVRVNIAPHH